MSSAASAARRRSPRDDFIHAARPLNLYLYPAEVDYPRREPLGPTWHNLEASVRATDPRLAAARGAAGGEEPLVYLSLGSLGSADVALMRTLVAELAETPYRFIVSKGPQARRVRARRRTWSAPSSCPQISVLPQVDLVITHGGNNTVTECLYFGKPMVVLPIFWDQHDNAQRLHETGFGLRLPTYSFDDEQMSDALSWILDDRSLRARAAAAGDRLRRRSGTALAAELIERVASEQSPRGG